MHRREVQLIERLVVDHAKKYNISQDKARTELLSTALSMVDRTHANRAEIQKNRTERAQQALIDNSQGEAPITIFSQGESWTDSKVIELFTASDEDYNNPYLLASEAAYIEEGNHHTQTHGSTDPDRQEKAR